MSFVKAKLNPVVSYHDFEILKMCYVFVEYERVVRYWFTGNAICKNDWRTIKSVSVVVDRENFIDKAWLENLDPMVRPLYLRTGFNRGGVLRSDTEFQVSVFLWLGYGPLTSTGVVYWNAVPRTRLYHGSGLWCPRVHSIVKQIKLIDWNSLQSV